MTNNMLNNYAIKKLNEIKSNIAIKLKTWKVLVHFNKLKEFITSFVTFLMTITMSKKHLNWYFIFTQKWIKVMKSKMWLKLLIFKIFKVYH